MMQQGVHSQISIPPDVYAQAKAYLEKQGIDDEVFLDDFVQDVYAEHQLNANAVETKPVWTPINDLQRLALATDAFELYCGGRARSGKTDLILGAAMTRHKDTIIFRKQYTQITALRDRAREILRGTGATYNGTEKLWRGIPGSRTLEFGAIDLEGDTDKYYGRPHDLICFDEIPKFKEEHYLTVWTWACTADPKNNPDQRVRIICTGNPPTKSTEYWVKRRWAAWVDDKHPNRAKPGELRWYVNLNGQDTEVEEHAEVYDDMGKRLKPVSRTFIPGELLHFYRGTSYEASLDALPERERRAFRDGDFSVAEDDQVHQVIPSEHVRLAQLRWESMKKPDVPLRGLGVDVARGGKDQTVIAKRYGAWFDTLIKYPASDTVTGGDVAAAITEHITDDEKSARIVIDLTGVGSSPYDILSSQGFNVDGFMGAESSPYTDASALLEFANRRSEAWWKFREDLEPDSGKDIALPPDPELMADLTAPTYEVDTQGIRIEKKENIIKRLGRSPDCGDAVVMNYNIDVRAGENMVYF